MALNFPANPQPGQQYPGPNGVTYTIGSATFNYYDVQSQAQDATWVTARYDALKGPYGLP